jgi:hypothetical protein
MINESKITKMFNDILEELDHIYAKLSLVLDDLDNTIHKTTDTEVKKDLDYLYSELESLMNEVKNYCIGDCSMCIKNCDIDCSDCNNCPHLSICIDQGKIEFSRKI